MEHAGLEPIVVALDLDWIAGGELSGEAGRNGGRGLGGAVAQACRAVGLHRAQDAKEVGVLVFAPPARSVARIDTPPVAPPRPLGFHSLHVGLERRSERGEALHALVPHRFFREGPRRGGSSPTPPTPTIFSFSFLLAVALVLALMLVLAFCREAGLLGDAQQLALVLRN